MTKIISLCTLITSIFLGTYNGHVAVCHRETKQPLIIYPYSSTVYTKFDQQLLLDGITITDQTQLVHLLDDYLS